MEKATILYLKNAFKLTLACLFGWSLCRLIPYFYGTWLLVTIIVVMIVQVNLGSLLRKSLGRFLGTSIGGGISLITLYLFDHNIEMNLLVFTLLAPQVTFVTAYLKDYTYAGILTLVTLAVCLLSPQSTVDLALGRILEIFAGIAISIFINIAVFPIRADRLFEEDCVDFFLRCRELIDLLFDPFSDRSLWEGMESRLLEKRKELEALAKDAQLEPFSSLFVREKSELVLDHERQIFRALTYMMINLSMARSDTFQIVMQMKSLRTLQREIDGLLDCLIHQGVISLSEKNRFETRMIKALDGVREALHRIFDEYAFEKKFTTHGFFVALQHFCDHLTQLAHLFTKE